MKKLITLSFLFFSLISSSPIDLTDATDVTEVGCLVPEKYCSGHKRMSLHFPTSLNDEA